jgi:acyl-CoA thioesterase YciA
MVFHKPVYVGDVLCCYTEIIKVGTTSITVMIEAYVLRARRMAEARIKVTEGRFTYVALDEKGKKRQVPPVAA